MLSLASQFLSDDSGVTAIEYGLIAGLIAVLLMATMSSTGLNLKTMWVRLAACLAAPTAVGCV